jgi:DNA-binding GntR family transcriptional regulator
MKRRMREHLLKNRVPSSGRRASRPGSLIKFDGRRIRSISIVGQKAQEAPPDIAFRKIKEMMYNNELVPGQKLLYNELATKFNMSITPIIQALNRLQFLNLVYSKRNRGYYVGEADPANAYELFVAREALEVSVLPDVIRNLTDDRLRSIQTAFESLARTASSPKYKRLLMIADAKFHLSIIKCAGNKVIYDLCNWVFEQIYLKYKPEYLRPERNKESGKEHVMLINALKEGDVRKATNLLRQHIRNGRRHIVGSLLEDKRYKL